MKDEIITLNEKKLIEDDWIAPKGWIRYGNLVIQEKASEERYSWEEANQQMATCLLKKKSGENKTFAAKLLSKEQLEKLSKEERKGDVCYWTTTAIDSVSHWIVSTDGTFFNSLNNYVNVCVRLGFELTE